MVSFGAAQHRQRRAPRSARGRFSRSRGARERRAATSEPGGKGSPSSGRSRTPSRCRSSSSRRSPIPFAGRINYFKVMSGVLKNDATLTNFTRGTVGALSARAGDAGQDRRGGAGTARRRHRRHRQAEGDGHRRHAGRQVRADLLSAGAAFPSRPSPLPSSRRRAPTKTASARASTRSWKKTCRCAFRAIRRPRSFCWPARASSTSRWSSPSCASASTWT